MKYSLGAEDIDALLIYQWTGARATVIAVQVFIIAGITWWIEAGTIARIGPGFSLLLWFVAKLDGVYLGYISYSSF